MKTILITGASGLIGKRLTEILLEKGFIVRHLSRKNGDGIIPTFIWNIENMVIDVKAFENVDAIIHLAGINVGDKRWTASYKNEILNSRILSSDLLVKSVKETSNRIKTIVSASAIGYYGNRSNEISNEDTKPAKDFFGKTCIAWEEAVRKAEEINIRTVQLRTGIVLSKNGGALTELIRPLKFFIKPIFYPGTQIYSWINIDDLCNTYIHSIENEKMNGAYNAVAPNTISYSVLLNEIALIMKRKVFPFPVFKWMLRIIIGKFADSLYQNINCSSKKLEATGFQFQFPEIKMALENLFRK